MTGTAHQDDRLETGWSAHTPAGDSVVRAALLALAGSAQDLARATGGEITRTEEVVRAYTGSSCAYMNTVLPISPPTDWDEVATPSAHMPVTLWSLWPTPDLRARRWNLVGHPPLMYRPAGAPSSLGSAELELLDVRDPATLDELNRTLVEGYPIPELSATPEIFPAALLDSPSWRFTLGLVREQPVAASVAYVTEQVVLVGWVATLASARRRGYGEVVTWRATLARPDRPAVLLASDDGRPVYERMGYVTLLRLTLWEHAAGSR